MMVPLSSYKTFDDVVWRWHEWERLLRIRLRTSHRKQLHQLCPDMANRRAAVVSLVEQMMTDEKTLLHTNGKAHGDWRYIARAYEAAEVAEEDVPPVSPLVAFAKSTLGLKPAGYQPALETSLLQEYPQWLRHYGWLSDFLLLFRSQSRVPLDFLLGAGIATMSVALKNTVRIQIWGGERTANLYILLVGPPGVRKSDPIRQARGMVNRAVPGVWHIDDNSKMALTLALSNSPTGLIVRDEFQGMLGSSLRQGYTGEVALALRSLFDAEVYNASFVKHGQLNINYPAVSVLGAMTGNAFWEACAKNAFAEGLFSRFLMLWDTTMGTTTRTVAPEEFRTVRSGLESFLAGLATGEDVVILVSNEMMAQIDEWEAGLREIVGSFGDASLAARAGIHAVRLAAVLWANAGRPPTYTYLPTAHLLAAESLVSRWLMETSQELEDNLAGTTRGLQMKRITKMLADAGGGLEYHAILTQMEMIEAELNPLLGALGRRHVVDWQKPAEDVQGQMREWVILLPGGET